MINFSDIPKIIYNRWNRFRLKRCGVKLSGYSCFLGRIYINISTESDVQIFNNVVFTNGRGANPLCGNINGAIQVSRNATLIVGSYTGISSAHIWAKEKIIIGSHVDIGADCIIMDNDCHSLDWSIRQNKDIDVSGEYIDYANSKSAPIIIEDNVLIGARSIILKGVTIGARSIIGAGSVVTRDILSDCIAAGNPCKVVKSLI